MDTRQAKTIRTLVIEDNATNLELMLYLLSTFGHTIITATDGEEGIKAALKEQPSLIICDIHLPKIDGYEVARQLKGHPSLRDVPLIAVTALAMVGDRERVLGAGFDGYIAKPITPEVFVKQVEEYLPVKDRLSVSMSEGAAFTDEPPSTIPRCGTVLVVNHSPANLELANNILGPSGFAVIAARDHEAALLLARETPPDLVLYDAHGYDDQAVSAVREMRAKTEFQTIPIILISSSTWRERDRNAGNLMGSVRFLVRPIEASFLLAEINACLVGMPAKPGGG